MIVAPSILSADFGNLEKSIQKVASAEWLHVDVMDGHFVPNISIGPVVVKGLRQYTKQVLDTHLMISDPIKYAEEFIKAGSDRITFHIEALDNPFKLINQLRDLKVKVGISIKPNTPTSAIKRWIEHIDQVLVMSVEPGFGGQKFIDNAIEKIEEISKLRRRYNKELLKIAEDFKISDNILLLSTIPFKNLSLPTRTTACFALVTAVYKSFVLCII